MLATYLRRTEQPEGCFTIKKSSYRALLGRAESRSLLNKWAGLRPGKRIGDRVDVQEALLSERIGLQAPAWGPSMPSRQGFFAPAAWFAVLCASPLVPRNGEPTWFRIAKPSPGESLAGAG